MEEERSKGEIKIEIDTERDYCILYFLTSVLFLCFVGEEKVGPTHTYIHGAHSVFVLEEKRYRFGNSSPRSYRANIMVGPMSDFFGIM